MKLVEILAREIEMWPEDAIRASYGADMNVYFEKIDGGIIETSYFTRGVDIPPFDVTRPQWQAERDRMKAMDTQQVTASTEHTYEQQLWDRAYADAWRHGFSVLGSDCSTEYFQSMTQASARMADAFMAERAKRVNNKS